MTSFFLQAESTLFFCRMSCMNKEELKAAVKPLRRYHSMLRYHLFCLSVRLIETCDEFCSCHVFADILSETEPLHMSEFHKEMATLLDHLTELMDWETLIDCYFENTGHSVMLPWYFVPKLVAQRVVGL